ncbi:MAG: biopolymer transporter ExbD [Gemmatimonadetes bacterium]|nr:biopolymer transporter ExbD [Gemmatimonadota bacterium]
MYAEVNVVSLVDLMMLLMVIFMITAPIMQGGVDLTLPKADARPVESKGGMVVSVTKDGKVFIDETPMTFSQFKSSFGIYAKRVGKEGVYIRGDGQATYGSLLRVLAVVKNAGVTNVALMAEPEETPP